jgi:hypothetical protein
MCFLFRAFIPFPHRPRLLPQA